MRLATFRPPESTLPRGGVVLGQHVVDVAADGRGHRTVLDLTTATPSDRAGAAAAAAAAVERERNDVVWRLEDVTLMSPIPSPPRLRDYVTFEAHITGSGATPAPAFQRYPSCYKGNHLSVEGDRATAPWPAYTRQLDYEAEVGCFISRPLVDATSADAATAIGGVCLFNDISARDIQFDEMATMLGPSKGKDFFNAVGPYLVTWDEIDDEFAIDVAVSIDGEHVSSGTTAERLFSIPEIVAWASLGEPLVPGEFIAIGTIPGGCGLESGRWLRPGETVTLQSSVLGELSTTIGHPSDHDVTETNRRFTAAERVGS